MKIKILKNTLKFVDYVCEDVYVIENIIFIKTNKNIKITTFDRLNKYPVFWDQTEGNRRDFFERLTSYL